MYAVMCMYVEAGLIPSSPLQYKLMYFNDNWIVF